MHATSVAIAAGELTADETRVLLELGRDLIDRILQGSRGGSGNGLSTITPVTSDALRAAAADLASWATADGPRVALKPLSAALARLAPFDMEA